MSIPTSPHGTKLMASRHAAAFPGACLKVSLALYITARLILSPVGDLHPGYLLQCGAGADPGSSQTVLC